jgi:hypothetical protein
MLLRLHKKKCNECRDCDSVLVNPQEDVVVGFRTESQFKNYVASRKKERDNAVNALLV